MVVSDLECPMMMYPIPSRAKIPSLLIEEDVPPDSIVVGIGDERDRKIRMPDEEYEMG